ncbi:hypothetical protein [Streptomyces sparsus]
MRQCTATAEVTALDLLVAILAGQGSVSSAELPGASEPLRCELGLWHEGDHADHVWDWGHQPTHALWARWNVDGSVRFASLPWCGTNCPSDEVCTLYRDHARDHSWNVHDPATEALRRKVLAENAGWLDRLTRKPH